MSCLMKVIFSGKPPPDPLVVALVSAEPAREIGENAGKKVTKIGRGFGYLEEVVLLKGKRCASIHGFSLHANTKIKTQDKKGLEKLIRYNTRGPLANERLSFIKRNKTTMVSLKLIRPFADGTTHVIFTPLEFIEKLVAIIPPLS